MFRVRFKIYRAVVAACFKDRAPAHSLNPNLTPLLRDDQWPCTTVI